MGRKGKSANKYRTVEISHENIKRENRKAYRGIILFSLVLLAIVIGTSYALFSTINISKKTVEVGAGTFKISFLDSNYINLENTYPMTDEEGLNTSAYKFTITNEGTINGKYNISLEENTENTLEKGYIKYSLKEDNGTWSTPRELPDDMMLTDNKQLNSGDSIKYELKLWLDLDAPNEVQGKHYQAKIVVSATQTNANILDVDQPIINLNGASVVNLEQNVGFVDPGVSSIKAKEEIDTSKVTKRYEYFDGANIIPVEMLDATKIGTYYIYYEVLDNDGNKGIETRIVNIYKPNTTPPTINVVGDDSIILNDGDKYKEQGAIAQDTVDGDLTNNIITIGEFNPQKGEIQNIKYLIIDSEGNTAGAIRNIISKKKSTNTNNNLTNQELQSTSSKPVCNFENVVSYSLNSGNIMGIEPNFIGKNMETQSVVLNCHSNAEIEEEYLNQLVSATNPEVLEIVNISEPQKTKDTYGQQYQYKIAIKGLKAGASKIVLSEGAIKDKSGNFNDETTTSYNITVSELEAEKSDIEVNMGDQTKKLGIKGSNLFETLIYQSSNEEIVKVDSEGIMTTVAPGRATITVIDPQSSARTVVNVKVVNTIKLTFTKGEGVESISSTSFSCTSEGSGECEITLPTFKEMEGYEAIGWNVDEYEGIGLAQGSKMKVSEDATFYAIAVKPQNKNIKNVYTYNQTPEANDYCVTGEETTCQVNNCIENRTKGSCSVGTIIKYAVNDSEDKIFFVLHDDGKRMTLQQRENTIMSEWYKEDNDNATGPLTALGKLDSVTSNWTNVNEQKYTMGTTNFLEHSTFANNPNATIYTKCNSLSTMDSCNDNTGYKMEKRTGKARMITGQEALATGCGEKTNKQNCPVWMYNYLSNSVENGATMNDNTNGVGYHTMSTYTGTQHDWYMMGSGYFSQTETINNNGIRAVIEIDK